ncbi:MAG: hypothetical protein K2Y71_12125 [Xanthobacteraceae bacterium]|nr:hypothetical protein [Xanthobacteraceae bacterium]
MDFAQQFRDVDANIGADIRLAQDTLGYDGIAAARRQDEGPFGWSSAQGPSISGADLPI